MRKSRVGAWMTALFVAAVMVLPVGTSLAAESNPGILPGGEGLEGAGVSKVYYGAHKGNPMYTRVLSTNEKGGLLLLSEYLLGDVHGKWYGVYFKEGRSSNVWAESTAKEWCADLYRDQFTVQEQDAVLPTSIDEETGGNYEVNGSMYKPCSISDEHLYFLSAKEAINGAYGFTNNASRVAYREDKLLADGTKEAYPWWLRSAYSTPYGAGAVDDDGDVLPSNVGFVWGGRPALRVNLEAVLFASAAVDGKRSGTVGAEALKAIENNGTNDWKLTLKEGTDKRPFAVTDQNRQTVSVGDAVQLDYTGAKTGSNEYVSAMLVDGSNQPVYYGRIKHVDGASEVTGSVEIAIPENLPLGDYTLQVFNEQYNGDKETDVASKLSVVPLTVVRKTVEPPVEDSEIQGVPVNATQGEKITFTVEGAGMDNVSPGRGDERWKPVSWSVNPSGDFVGGYTQSFETSGMKPGEHTLVITFAQEWHDGSTWVDTGDHSTKDFPFTLLAAPPQGGGEPSVPVATPTDEPGTPSDLTGSNPGTGDPVRIGWLVAAGVAAFGAAAGLVRQRKKA